MYDIFFTGTDFFLSLVFSVMVFHADFNYIYGTIILCWAHPHTPAAHLASVCFGGCPADRGVVWLVCYLSFWGLLWREGLKGVIVAFTWLFSLPRPTSPLCYEDEFGSWAKLKPGPGNFLFLWPP